MAVKRGIILLCCILFIIAGRANAQSVDSLWIRTNHDLDTLKKQGNALLSNRAYHKFINRVFSQVAVGPTNGANLANYASFEPVAGSFSFNGFTPINARDDGSRRMSYLNFSVKGGLDGNNVGALFSNSKLNTNVTVSLRYHFGLNKSQITYSPATKFSVVQQKIRLINQQRDEVNNFMEMIGDLNNRVQDAMAKDTMLKIKRTGEKNMLRTVRVSSLQSGDGHLADSLQHILQRITKLDGQITNQRIAVDSLLNLRDWYQRKYVPQSSAYMHIRQALQDIDSRYTAKREDIEMNAYIERIHFGWFSINVDFNKQKYYTFFDTLAFNNQIEKKVLDAFNFGVMYNFFWQNISKGQILYINIGLSRLKTNNTGDLSATEINDSRTITNNDVKRLINTKYSAFTSPIVEFRAWQFYSNIYYLFGKQNVSGIHVFPEINFRNTSKTVTNLGIGYVISFNDTKKTKTLINAEAYVKFTDVGNALHQEPGFYKRNEIGISFGIPFNFIIAPEK